MVGSVRWQSPQTTIGAASWLQRTGLAPKARVGTGELDGLKRSALSGSDLS